MTREFTLAEALIACQGDRVNELVQRKLDSGVSAVEIITECDQGMTELGARFAAGECFIPELMIGGKIMKEVNAKLAPLLEEGFRLNDPVGTAVVGSVRGDMHNIGKDIVVMMLNGSRRFSASASCSPPAGDRSSTPSPRSPTPGCAKTST
jgi:5-methyltetrahydrofolate--homocysteine methyltransferase